MNAIKRNIPWLLAAVAITLVTLGVLFVPTAQAAETADTGEWGFSLAGYSPDMRIFNEDLLVATGQVINDNVAVLNGDVTIRAGGAINGDLSVVRGDVDVAGKIQGDLAVVQGDAKLRSSARIDGDVSIVAGEVERADGAYVGGNFVGGKNREWRGLFDEENGADTRSTPELRGPQSQRSWLVGFLWRLVQAVLWTLLITGLVVLITWLAPAQVQRVAQTAEAEPALSFAVGLVVSLVVAFLSMGLFATLCLAPAGFLLSSLLAIVGLFGWAATVSWIGDKLAALSADGSTARVPHLIYVMLTALVLTGLTLFSWALLACVGFVVGLLLVSPGVGGVLVSLARRSGRMGPAPVPAEPTTPGAPSGDSAGDSADDSIDKDTTDSGTDSENGSENGSESDRDIEGRDGETAGDFHTGDELGLTAEERSALQTGAGITPSGPDDFTRLKGIGPAFDQRLKAAGITTFAALAALSPEDVSAIVGWPPERVVRDELLEQAAELAKEE